MKEMNKRVHESMEELLRALNGANFTEAKNAMVTAIMSEHNTIQQNFFRALSETIKEMSEFKFVDPRNQASIDWCKKVSEVETYFPYI